jgi:hypothetical protein
VNFRLPGVVKILYSPGTAIKTNIDVSDFTARREQVVRGFYETGRVFKGSKASADKIRDEAEAANPTVEEDQDY